MCFASERFVFAGGVARNACLKSLMEHELGITLTIPASPQTVGALGAALYAAQQMQKSEMVLEA
jgi:activator of 2-hydroxyglutaryl-CoA dehydratase